MTEETIRYLEDLKDGRKVTLTKQTPDELRSGHAEDASHLFKFELPL